MDICCSTQGKSVLFRRHWNRSHRAVGNRSIRPRSIPLDLAKCATRNQETPVLGKLLVVIPLNSINGDARLNGSAAEANKKNCSKKTANKLLEL
eukprot:scaffold24618_cov127-Cylindrotheca_fusiformis.AAC.4